MRGEFNNGSAVSRDITRHFSAPLGVRQRLAARDSSPGGCRMPGLRCRHQTKGLWRLDISPKVPSPASERVAVLGRYALGQPGDCMWPDNRYLASGQRNVKSRQIVQRAKRQSITLTGLGNATILCADPGSGVHHVPFDQTTRRRFVTLFGGAALTAATTVAARAQSAAKPARQLAAKTPDAAADKLDLLLPQAKALGAPMAAVERAIAISRQPVFSKKDVLAVFDISQPSAAKRFFVLDFKLGEATAHYAAHGRTNGPNAKATKFKGFQKDLDMVPLGPLKTAHSEVMDHYKTIVDRYDGTVYRNMVVVELEGVASYNSYINHTPPFKWIPP